MMPPAPARQRPLHAPVLVDTGGMPGARGHRRARAPALVSPRDPGATNPRVAERPERGGTRRLQPALWTLFASTLLAGAFLLDCVSGNEVSASLFYVVGIAVASWFIGLRSGLVIACLSAVAWGGAVEIVGPVFSKASVFYWNLGVELVIYGTVAVAVARVRDGLRHERQLVEQLTHVTAVLERETRAVGDLQREMLPAAPPEVPGYEWQLFYATSTQAGGDYYDFFRLPEARIGVLIGDASGHGAQAAVLVAMTRVLLQTSAESLVSPGRVLARLGSQLARTVPSGRFVTACYAALEPATGRVTFSLAGHPPPLLLRGGGDTLEELPLCGGPPLGLFADSLFVSGVSVLRPGDTLILYTDGLTEGMGPTRELFGDDALRRTIRGAGPLPLPKLLERVVTRFDAHRSGAPLEDDVTLLMLRRTS
jgi:serine phosphatase RsbU (regulator of sigma subunit)